MKIIHPLPPGIVEHAPATAVSRAARDGGPTAAPAATATAAAAAAHGATVELSQTAASLRTHAAPAEIDAAKVDRIAQSIAEGRFAVNAEAIADKLIANAQELLGKVQR